MANFDNSKRDLATNPAYQDLVDSFQRGVASQIARLESVSQESNVASINTQAGIVKGMRLGLAILTEYERVATKKPSDEGAE